MCDKSKMSVETVLWGAQDVTWREQEDVSLFQARCFYPTVQLLLLGPHEWPRLFDVFALEIKGIADHCRVDHDGVDRRSSRISISHLIACLTLLGQRQGGSAMVMQSLFPEQGGYLAMHYQSSHQPLIRRCIQILSVLPRQYHVALGGVDAVATQLSTLRVLSSVKIWVGEAARILHGFKGVPSILVPFDIPNRQWLAEGISQLSHTQATLKGSKTQTISDGVHLGLGCGCVGVVTPSHTQTEVFVLEIFEAIFGITIN